MKILEIIIFHVIGHHLFTFKVKKTEFIRFNKSKMNKQQIERLKQVSSVTMCMSLMWVLINDKLGDPFIQNCLLVETMIYFSTDLLITKKTDFMIHHIAAIILLLDLSINWYPTKDIIFIGKLLIPCEISTIFLGIKHVILTFPGLKDEIPLFNRFIDVCFLISFVTFRFIWVLYNVFTHQFVQIVFVYPYGNIRLFCFIVLMQLNIQWLVKIIKIARSQNR